MSYNSLTSQLYYDPSHRYLLENAKIYHYFTQQIKYVVLF